MLNARLLHPLVRRLASSASPVGSRSAAEARRATYRSARRRAWSSRNAGACRPERQDHVRWTRADVTRAESWISLIRWSAGDRSSVYVCDERHALDPDRAVKRGRDHAGLGLPSHRAYRRHESIARLQSADTHARGAHADLSVLDVSRSRTADLAVVRASATPDMSAEHRG